MNGSYGPMNAIFPGRIVDHLCGDITAHGFSRASRRKTLEIFEFAEQADLTDWTEFRTSWSDLPMDAYMADGGRYRRRRHVNMGMHRPDYDLLLQPPWPHYQSLEYNDLNGGFERFFDPIAETIVTGATMIGVLALGGQIADRLMPDRD